MRRDRLSERFVILLADDDPGDQELTRRALASEDLSVDLHIVDDGEEALDYLMQRGDYEDFSLLRVVTGYGLPTLAAVGFATLVFCRRDL